MCYADEASNCIDPSVFTQIQCFRCVSGCSFECSIAMRCAQSFVFFRIKLYTNRKHKHNVCDKFLRRCDTLPVFASASGVLHRQTRCRFRATSHCLCNAIYANIYCKNIVWRSFEAFTSFIWLDYPHFAFTLTIQAVRVCWCACGIQCIVLCVLRSGFSPFTTNFRFVFRQLCEWCSVRERVDLPIEIFAVYVCECC